jgi:pullulanase
MFRRFMIDSTSFWTSEYKLGGFRFDLMGIHDTETMNQLTAKNKEINPNIVIYGEPWAGGTTALPSGYTAAVQGNIASFEGYGAFNDKLRDSLISGGLAPLYSRGWVTQTKYPVAPRDIVPNIQGHTGSFSTDADKAVSYVTCHDNYTLRDRAVIADVSNSDIDVSNYKSEATLKKMNALANSIVFTSQGTSFMLAGEEMLRSKILYDTNGEPIPAVNENGDTLNIPAVSGNSYNSSYKTNEINYELKIDNYDLFETYQKLVQLKKTSPSLRSKTANNVEILNDGCVLKITLNDGDKTYEIYHKNGVGNEEPSSSGVNILSLLTLGLMGCSNNGSSSSGSSSSEFIVKPFSIDTTGYSLYLDTLGRELTSTTMELKPFETIIIYK